jgi:hypothetical protein
VVGLIGIFEKEKNTQNCPQAKDQHRPTGSRIGLPGQPEPGHVSDGCHRQKHDNVFRIPAHIKQIAAGKEQDPTPSMRKKKEQGCDDREKYEELDGIKFHAMHL